MSVAGNVLRTAFTGDDNQTYDYLPIIAAIGVVAYIVYAGIALMWFKQEWNPLTYGAGLGTVLAAAGGAQRFRDGPPAPPDGPSTTISASKVTVNQKE